METIPPSRSLKATRSNSIGYAEKQSKKYKKWSIGGLFRRKKKVSDTDSSSSSDDADKKGFLNRRRSIRKGRNRSKDFTERAMVSYPVRHNADVVRFEQSERTDISECTPVSSYNEPLSKRQHKLSKYSGRSLDDVGHESVRTQIKGRMERSSKERLRDESSSDETAESSVQNKSVKAGSRDGSLSLRSRTSRTERYKKRVLRHDESLRDTHDSPSSRTSRSFEVLSEMRSNDKAFPNNQWTADIVYYESSDYETKYTAKMKSASSSPVQSPKARHKNSLCHTSLPTPGSNFAPTRARDEVAVSNNDLSYSYYPQPFNHSKQKPSQRCINTIPPRLPKSNSDVVFRESPISRPMHTKNVPNHSKTIISPPLKQHKMQTPPKPPPRDPLRKVIIYNDSNNKTSPYPNLYECDKNIKQLNYNEYPEFGSSDSAFRRVHLNPQANHMDILASNESHIANSDDSVIPTEKEMTCTTPLTYQRHITVYPECSGINDREAVTANTQSEAILGKVPNQYHYLTDQPRSRKPIHIACKTNHQLPNERYLSDTQVATIKDHSATQPPTPLTKSEEVLNARDFWNLKDQKSSEKLYLSDDSSNIKQSNLQNITTVDRLRSVSPYASESLNVEHTTELNPVKRKDWSVLESSHSELRDISRSPHFERLTPNDISCIPVESAIFNDNAERDYQSNLIMNQLSAQSCESEMSPIAKYSPATQNNTDLKINSASESEHYDEDHDNINSDRNSKNHNSLEDALNELEEIYKSLKLDDDKYFENGGDDHIEYNKDSLDDSNWNEWIHPTGVQSDLSYKYSKSTLESADNIVSPNKRSNSRRSETPNPVTDDMAYRRLIKKEKPPSQEKEVISQAGSFLLVSPTLSPPPFFELTSPLQVNKEPDITYDDVVYRNIQHTNNTFKILDPQPPFGIPLWPVTPAPNSSYLCVNSKETYRPTFKPKKYPDIVADDLAFRNLRKDKNKEQLSKINADQDQTKKSTVSGTLVDPQKIRKKNCDKDFIAPFNRRLAYNNNNLEEDLDELQSFAFVTDTNKVSGFVPKAQYAKPVMLQSIFNTKNRFSAEDSNTTSRNPTSFSTGISWPLSSTTLTESNTNALTQDAKQLIYNEHEVANPKLPVYNSLGKSETLSKITDFDKKSVSPVHQTLDNPTFAHNKRKFESSLILNDVNSNNGISENRDLYEELYELNDLEGVSKNPMNIFEEDDSKKRSCSEESSKFHAQSNSHDFDKVPTCEMVNLNRLCINEDQKHENKQPAITDNTTGVEVRQSLADLWLELNESSDFYFGEHNQDCEKEHCSNYENSTSNNSNSEIPNQYLTNETTHLKESVGSNYEFEVQDTSPMPCSEVNLLNVAKPIVFSLNEDSDINKTPCQPLSQDSEEDRANIVSNPPLCTAMSDEGTKENCVPACKHHAFLVCMVWLHQLASLDLLTILSIILAIAALILVITL